ncbi:hypothetical protein SeLEV6574_g04802 [Synchytrium endobioticum]|uniref:CDC20/Fizzy WD40 domain-containing protein n=2 Tax=Synchytrium endobioticum TaxID=286115 RepID=A0A507CXT7_9FUNG|nr:hypothetical protein SeLEV6574_g04802 [Synchytrium endobioticum]
MPPLESTPKRINASTSSSILDRMSPAQLQLKKSASKRGRRSSGVSLHHGKGMNLMNSPGASRSHGRSNTKVGGEHEPSLKMGGGACSPTGKTPRKGSKMNDYAERGNGTPNRSLLRTRDTLPSDMKQLLKTQVVVGGKRTKEGNHRFIPNRDAMDMASSQLNIARKENPDKPCYLDPAHLAYQEEIAKACGLALDKRILSFALEPPAPAQNDLRTQWSRPLRPNATTKRRIATMPDRVLDAPGMVDDYYLNLLDWSSQNILAVGLDKTVYLWNAKTGSVDELCTLTGDEDYVASLSWVHDGSYLAVGTNEGSTQIWDIEGGSLIRNMRGHISRVGVMSWDRHVLSSGARDGSIWNHDVRIANHKVAELTNHTGEVCGLQWRADGAFLASGGNDNLLNIWDARSTIPRFTKSNHTAAVKAIAWCPWQINVLASGGGTNDRHIHFWNSSTAARLSSVDTGSQVTSIRWSLEYKEFVSSHGFPHNHISVWAYPSLGKIVDLPGHDSRVLHTALSPDGQTLATGAADENLKFWKVFESRKKLSGGVGTAGAGGLTGAASTKDENDTSDLVKEVKRMSLR